jgi:hypothetical protein
MEESEGPMNIFKIFDTIEEAVASSQRLPPPFSQWSLMNRHNFMRLMDKMRSSVSPELKQARAISKDVQRLLGEAQDQAETILREAKEKVQKQHDALRAERESLINATEVVQMARKRAEEIERAAQQAADDVELATRARCEELRREAEEYAATVRRRAEEEARIHEAELERYAVKLLSSMEQELGRAVQVVRSHRQSLETPASKKEEEDTVTLEPAQVQRVVAGAKIAAAPVLAVPRDLEAPTAKGGRRTA